MLNERCAHKALSAGRQRASAAVVGVVVVVAALAAGPARAAEDAGHEGVPVGVNAGYAFRSVVSFDGADDRAHGAAASVVVDSPPLLWGFGLRGEGLALAWPGTAKVDRGLAFFAGGGALTYAFDDTHVAALASIGAVGGVVVDGDDVAPTWAPTIGLLLRFPLTAAAAVDARLVVPFVQDERLPLQAAAMIGVSLAPDVVVRAAMEGRSPLALVLPALD